MSSTKPKPERCTTSTSSSLARVERSRAGLNRFGWKALQVPDGCWRGWRPDSRLSEPWWPGTTTWQKIWSRR